MKEPASQFTLRLLQSLRAMLEESAKERGRSLQVEITERLLESFGVSNDDDVKIEQIARRVVREELAQHGLTRSEG